MSESYCVRCWVDIKKDKTIPLCSACEEKWRKEFEPKL